MMRLLQNNISTLGRYTRDKYIGIYLKDLDTYKQDYTLRAQDCKNLKRIRESFALQWDDTG